MIAITFIDFFREKFERDEPYSIYVLRDGDTVLYVGMSNEYLWSRWFGGGTSHMHIVRTKEGTTVPLANGGHVASRIELNYPESLEWIFELWTDEDCRQYLSEFNPDAANMHMTRYLETEMIRHRKPLYNVQGNSGGSWLPRTQKEIEEEKEVEKAYRRIFG